MAISTNGGSNPTAVNYNNQPVSEVLYNGIHVWLDGPVEGVWPNILKIKLNGGSWSNVTTQVFGDHYPSNNTVWPEWPSDISWTKLLYTDKAKNFFNGRELSEIYPYPDLITDSTAGLRPESVWPEGYRYLNAINDVNGERIVNFYNYYYYSQGAVDIGFNNVLPKSITYEGQTYKVYTKHVFVWSNGSDKDPERYSGITFDNSSLQSAAVQWYAGPGHDPNAQYHTKIEGTTGPVLGFHRELIINY